MKNEIVDGEHKRLDSPLPRLGIAVPGWGMPYVWEPRPGDYIADGSEDFVHQWRGSFIGVDTGFDPCDIDMAED